MPMTAQLGRRYTFFSSSSFRASKHHFARSWLALSEHRPGRLATREAREGSEEGSEGEGSEGGPQG